MPFCSCKVIKSSALKVVLYFLSLLWVAVDDPALAASWQRVSDNTVFGTGQIERDEIQRFQKVYDNRVREVILGDLGGSVIGGLDIADQILKDEVSVRVVGACLSSCANYLFLAGKQKVIAPGGLVGFHGSPFAGTLLLPDWESIFAGQAMAEGLSEIEIRHEIEIRKMIFSRERQFFDQVGIDFDLFIKSIDGERSKRVNGCSPKSLYLFPTKSMFEAYGVKNLFGDQSWSLLHLYGEPCIDAINYINLEEALGKTNWATRKSPSNLTKTCSELNRNLEENRKNADDEQFIMGKITELTAKSLKEAEAAFETASCR